jgi:hypothetical protein
MHPNKDQIARPAKGRFFAYNVSEVLRLLGEFEFSQPADRKRLDVLFRNPNHASEFGMPVANLFPADAIVVYSFTEEHTQMLAKSAVTAALEQLSILESREGHECNRHKTISFRAYLGDLGKLTVTRHLLVATLAKYRGDAKFSHAFKPSAVKSGERIVCAIELA